MRRGCFITFEGLDGSGKTTQLRLLSQALEQQGHSVVVTRQPGDTPLGDRIRTLLLDSKTTDVAPMAEMALMFADRAQSVQEIITPALHAGKIVLCDRFTDSTEAYQGGGREIGSQHVLALHRLLCGSLQPDLTLLLLPDLDASLARARNRKSPGLNPESADRFERENRAFYQKVLFKYQELAVRDSHRIVVFADDLPIQPLHQRILAAVQIKLATLLSLSVR